MKRLAPVPVQLSKHRIEALSDGLFAIVMTLLVLELKVPDLPRSAQDPQMWAKLRELGPSFFTFGLTFLISSMFWFLHHMMFQFTRYLTRKVVWMNLMLLMFVSLLPFSAGMLGHFLGSRVAQIVYYGNLFAISGLMCVQWEYLRRHELVSEEIDPRVENRMTQRLRRIPLVSVGALIAGAYRPDLVIVGVAGALAVFALGSRLSSRFR